MTAATYQPDTRRQLGRELRHSRYLSYQIMEAHINGEPCDALVDDLRDTIDRIDGLAAQLNVEVPE